MRVSERLCKQLKRQELFAEVPNSMNFAYYLALRWIQVPLLIAFTLRATEAFVWMWGEYRIVAAYFPIIFSSCIFAMLALNVELGLFHLSSKKYRRILLIGSGCLLFYLLRVLNLVQYGNLQHPFNAVKIPPTYESYVISAENSIGGRFETFRDNMQKIHFNVNKYNVILYADVRKRLNKVRKEINLDTVLLQNQLSLYYTYIGLFKKVAAESTNHWLVTFEDDAVYYDERFKTQLENTIIQYSDLDMIWLDSRANYIQAITGRVLDGTAANIFKTSSLKKIALLLDIEGEFIHSYVKNKQKVPIYIDQVLSTLCNTGVLKCTSIPIIHEFGFKSTITV